MFSCGANTRIFVLLIAILFALSTAGSAKQMSSPADTFVPSYGNLPIAFEMNAGQIAKNVHFLFQGRSMHLFLTESGPVIRVFRDPAEPLGKAPQDQESAAVFLRFLGAKLPRIEGERRLPGESNYLIGSPEHWHTHVRRYAQVRYRKVYPGIDVVVYGSQQNLEYDWRVAPGANSSLIKMQFAGADRIRVDESGNLILHTAAGEIQQKLPKAYQATSGGRREIPVRYVLNGFDVSFALGKYDHRRALVIDPVLSYATFLGGSQPDSANAIAVDRDGSAFVAGTTSSLDFPITPGAYRTHCNTNCNNPYVAFVTKLNSSGTGVEYSTYFGSDGDSFYSGNGLSVDSSGNAYLVGMTNAPNFPGKIIGQLNPKILTAYSAKLNPTGSGLVYALAWGGVNETCYPYPFGTEAFGVAVDKNGRAWVTGATSTSDFPTTNTAYQHSLAGGCDAVYPIEGDAFVSVINAAGTGFSYSTYIGGYGLDWANEIALDGNGDAYIAGENVYGGYPTTPGAFMPNFPSTSGLSTGIITKLNLNTGLVYSTYLGGSDQSNVAAIRLDHQENAFVTGWTTTPDFPTTPGTFKRTFSNTTAQEVYVSKLNASGSALIYSTFLGNGTPAGIAVDPNSERAIVTGGTNNSTGDFPLTSNAIQKILCNPYGNAFVSEFNANGSNVMFSTYLSGSNPFQYWNDSGTAIALDQRGAIYVAGQASARNFPVTYHAFETRYGGGYTDGFVAKIQSACVPEGRQPFVDFCFPKDGDTISQPVSVTAVSVDSSAVNHISLFADGKPIYSQALTSIDAVIQLSTGPHTLKVQATDIGGRTLTKSISITVK